MMKYIQIPLVSGVITMEVSDEGFGTIQDGLPREVCPSCAEPACCNNCDGSRGADENNGETEYDAVARQRYNAYLDAIESVALGHACAGYDVTHEKYRKGLEAAMDAASNNLE